MKKFVSVAVLPSLIAFAAADALAAGGNPTARPTGLDRALIRMSPQGAANQQGTLNANPVSRPFGPAPASAASATPAVPATPATPAQPADPATDTPATRAIPATPATPAVPPKPPGK
jgi:hypothetical protein